MPRSQTTHAATRRAILLGGVGLAAGAAAACTTTREDRTADGFAELSDQRGSVSPIRADERAARRRRLGTILAGRGLDAMLMEGGATMTYLSGVSWGRSERFFGLVVLADGSHFWIAWQEDEYPWRPLADALAQRRARRVAIEPSLRIVFAERLANQIGRDRVESGAGAEVVVALRACKDAHEIAILRRANELTQLALHAVAHRLAPGMKGSEVAALVDRAHRKLGFTNSWNLSLIGPAAALPHGEPDERALARGSLLLVDAGGDFHGYQSDESRTWIFDGKPSAEIERAWNAVRDAQLAGFDAIRAGVLCGDVDRAARAMLVQRGFAAGFAEFTHRLGASGMTLSDEPGLYFPGRFGVRLEDVVLVTDDGADHFGTWQQAPTSPE